MDNLPKDPPDQNNNNNNSAPPSFGSGFNPHSNPVDPNNPYSSQPPVSETPNIPDPHPNSVHSEVAQHRPRDIHGHFLPYEHPNLPQTPSAPQTAPAPPASPAGGPNLPLPIQVTQNNKYSEKNDPPLVSVSVTNPITYLKLFIKRLFRNEGITIKIKPFTAIAMIIALSTAFGTGFNVARMFFPNSSPILHRAITLQGNAQMSESGQYYLSLPDNTLWALRATNPNINLNNLINRQVLVKGNMTAEANVVEVKEVIAFDKFTPRSSSSEVGPTPVIYAPTP